MYLALNVLGLLVFLALGWLFSHDRSGIRWRSVAVLTVLNLLIAWGLTSFAWGRAIVRGAAAGFGELVSVAWEGINFALANWVGANGVDPEPVNFVVSALLPILLIVPVFDTLTYLGILPWTIRWIGRGLSAVTGQPRFEAFYAIEMMFLGNTEAVAVSKLQLQRMSPARDVVIAMMTMSCVSAPILASYMQMVPAEFVLTAVPVNCLNALIVAGMLYPVEVPAQDDVVITYGGPEAEVAGSEATAEVSQDHEDDATGVLARLRRRRAERPAREPYFSFLGDSILAAGKLILIITATVITFVALAALIDKILGAIWSPLSLEKIVGVVLYVPALLLGLDPSSAWDMSQVMGLKLVTNEFVAMGEVSGPMAGYAAHMRAVLTVFLTSFANLGTLGMIIGSFKGIVDKERNDLISRNVGRMLLSGVLVSLMSAATVGLFVW